MRLLLDGEDTAVTRQTARALADVGTVAAVRLIALAVDAADDNQADWLQTGVQEALWEATGRADNAPPDIAAACRVLAGDEETAVRRGAAEVLAWTQDARS